MHKPKEERVHEVFESIHEKYDKMNTVISLNQHTNWRRDVMKKMNVSLGASALDLCCGTADWTIQLAEAAGENGYIKGLDFSENMLRAGQEKVARLGFENIELLHGNAMDIPFADETFDFVTIGFGLRNVPDYDTVLREMYRILKPGGLAVSLETSQPEKRVVNKAYSIYFTKVMPLLGKYIAGKYKEYSWLQESTMSFPNKNLLSIMFAEAGFDKVQVSSYSFGAAAAHFAYKGVTEDK
ncbi:demethylmenaquinone methyltransferase [Alteribacillus sp. HJP-4]|uniref:demethylmenaquinone methyltransferase n=1 Tax=Alteribacillus sp. HJP-4 TaxID=2775394 RepID=UPI0035CCE483